MKLLAALIPAFFVIACFHGMFVTGLAASFRAFGVRNQVGAITNFIPTIWSGRILRTLEKTHVFGAPGVVNREYEGEIRTAGDTVKILSIGDVTISNYTRNADIPAPEVLSDAALTLVIDQAKVFNFAVDDVDQVQSVGNLVDEATANAGGGLRDVSDQFIAGKYVDADADNIIGSDAAPEFPDATTAYTLLVDLGVLLDEQDVPTEGRWVIVPPWYAGLLSKNDQFISADANVLRAGFSGRAGGFDVLTSNNVKTIVNGSAQTVYQIMAGNTSAISFAEQILKTEAYRPEKRFSDAVKGLYVYGAKTVRPEALANLKVRRA